MEKVLNFKNIILMQLALGEYHQTILQYIA